MQPCPPMKQSPLSPHTLCSAITTSLSGPVTESHASMPLHILFPHQEYPANSFVFLENSSLSENLTQSSYLSGKVSLVQKTVNHYFLLPSRPSCPFGNLSPCLLYLTSGGQRLCSAFRSDPWPKLMELFVVVWLYEEWANGPWHKFQGWCSSKALAFSPMRPHYYKENLLNAESSQHHLWATTTQTQKAVSMVMSSPLLTLFPADYSSYNDCFLLMIA